MKKTNIKSNKGITLVALIVTIIVLLILTTVTIKTLTDSGIIGRAKSATSKYTIAGEKEQISLGYVNYQMEKMRGENATLTVQDAVVDGDETSGWTITFDKTGNRYSLSPEGNPEENPKSEEEKLLEEYIAVGDKIPLADIYDISDNTFVGNKIIPEANTKLTYITLPNSGLMTIENVNGVISGTLMCWCKYENALYEFKSDIIFENGAWMSENRKMTYLYTNHGTEGTKVQYSYDGTEANKKEWTVLYDYGDTVEIISPEVMGNLILGADDETAIGTNDAEKAMYSYNNAVKRTNEYASSLITNPNKISARSVGSNPKNPNAESGMYKSDLLAQLCGGQYNGKVKDADNNYRQDYMRISYFGINKNEYYWINSRDIYIRNGAEVEYNLKYIDNDGRLNATNLFVVRDTDAISALAYNFSVRPIVKVKKADVGL